MIESAATNPDVAAINVMETEALAPPASEPRGQATSTPLCEHCPRLDDAETKVELSSSFVTNITPVAVQLESLVTLMV